MVMSSSSYLAQKAGVLQMGKLRTKLGSSCTPWYPRPIQLHESPRSGEPLRTMQITDYRSIFQKFAHRLRQFRRCEDLRTAIRFRLD